MFLVQSDLVTDRLKSIPSRAHTIMNLGNILNHKPNLSSSFRPISQHQSPSPQQMYVTSAECLLHLHQPITSPMPSPVQAGPSFHDPHACTPHPFSLPLCTYRLILTRLNPVIRSSHSPPALRSNPNVHTLPPMTLLAASCSGKGSAGYTPA